MTTRIAHISDLHFMPRLAEQAAALVQSIHDARPDILLVTGDLTRSGTNLEFAAAAKFLANFQIRKMVIPGNHDIPLFDRLTSPFRRFARYFPDQPAILTTSDVALVSLNSSVGMQLRPDWSLGRIVAARLDRAAKLLQTVSDERLKVVATHHPLRQHPLDLTRSDTHGGPAAFQTLSGAGMDLLLHGHLHRHTVTCISMEDREVCEIGASTVLSNRERSGPAGYNLLEVDGSRWDLEVTVWRNGAYLKQ